MFLTGFHLPERRNVQTDFGCADFGAQLFAQMFGAQIFAQILNAQIFALIFDALIFARTLMRRFSSRFFLCLCGLRTGMQKCAQNLQKKPRRPSSFARVGTLFRLRFLEQTARHTITARPEYSRKAFEHPLRHHLVQRHACICFKIFQKENLRIIRRAHYTRHSSFEVLVSLHRKAVLEW